MLNPAAVAQNTLVVGMMGSGKTTFAIKLMLNTPAACIFIFDYENRTAPRLGLKPCFTENELLAAIETRWVVFNPARMFPPREGDRDILSPKKRAFAFFCAWAFKVCEGGPGQKIISLPEIWRFCTPDSIPPEFAQIMQMGRELGIHAILDTQRPELVNGSVVGGATELVCFKLIGPDALKTVAKLGVDRDQVARLALGSFISRDQVTGSTLAGKMF